MTGSRLKEEALGIGHVRYNQYSNMAPRLSGQTSIFGVVFFVSKSLLGIERQRKLEKFAILTRKPRSHVRILIYRTWPINTSELRFVKHYAGHREQRSPI